jgi:hypothetical protein
MKNISENKKEQKVRNNHDYAGDVMKVIQALQNMDKNFANLPYYHAYKRMVEAAIARLYTLSSTLYTKPQAPIREEKTLSMPIDKIGEIKPDVIKKMADTGLNIKMEGDEDNVVKIDISKLSPEEKTEFHKKLSDIMSSYQDKASLQEYQVYSKKQLKNKIIREKAEKQGYQVSSIYTKKELLNKYKKNG